MREWEHLSHGDADGQVPENIADRLAAVAAASPLSGSSGRGVLDHGRRSLRAQGVVGIVATNDGVLEILPKIDVDGGKDIATQHAMIRRRLIHMLGVVLDLKIDLGPETRLDQQRETLLEVLVRIYCDKLAEAVRRGMPRLYVRREDDLPALRGRLDVNRQFTRHAVNPSRLACRFDELSEDIELNRVVKASVKHLIRISRSAANQHRLRELSFIYSDVSDVPPASLRWDEIVIDRTSERWGELLRLSRLFLQRSYQTTTGGQGHGSALLFEMNVLFEEYVGRMICRAASGTDLAVSLQGGGRYCLLDEHANSGLFQTRPDILISENGVPTHVIDTKWKRIASRLDDRKQGVSQSDVYQMMAYGQLYEVPRLTLLYPHHTGLEAIEGVQARYRVNGREISLETTSIDIASGERILDRLRHLLGLENLEQRTGAA